MIRQMGNIKMIAYNLKWSMLLTKNNRNENELSSLHEAHASSAERLSSLTLCKSSTKTSARESQLDWLYMETVAKWRPVMHKQTFWKLRI